MPITAYVLLKLRPAPIEQLKKEIDKIQQIKDCSIVTGEVDAILFIEVEDTQELFEVAKKLRDIPFVLDTRTSIVISKCK
ncbi:MAG: Lrp/AsnC family transcriptional regulator [Candidatus Njordarchaeia archaeon]|nr:Lrp/AsnC ligand binding domain-containing protein [Candidatus Korarchaeota archaeon]